VLAFDYGQRRIGVAVGQTLTNTATALEVLPSDNEQLLWSGLDRLIKEWQPSLFVLGKPTHADGSETPLAESIKRFGDQLQARYNLELQYIDERLSSHAAQALLDNELNSNAGTRHGKRTNKKSARQDIDHVAAKLILESWFNENSK
jgi:putative Holliday junction resolvase